MVVLVAGLAFGLALVMSGVVNQLSQEGRQTVELFDADQWIVADGVSGPFTSSQVVSAALARSVADDPGVRAVTPMLIGRTVIDGRDVNVVGLDPTSDALPANLSALARATDGSAVADETLGLEVGEHLDIGGESVRVGSTVTDTSFFFSAPTVFLPIDTVQRLMFASEDVASAIVVEGSVSSLPAGTIGLDNSQVLADFDRVIRSTADTIAIVNSLLWLMAAGAVAAIVYVGVLERTTDFATLKALGATNRSLLAGLVAQTAVVSLFSALTAVAICQAISPSFSFPVSVPSAAYVRLPVIAMVVGVLASTAGIRKISRIDPTLAFGGAS